MPLSRKPSNHRGGLLDEFAEIEALQDRVVARNIVKWDGGQLDDRKYINKR
jgi:hypothetical protein